MQGTVTVLDCVQVCCSICETRERQMNWGLCECVLQHMRDQRETDELGTVCMSAAAYVRPERDR